MSRPASKRALDAIVAAVVVALGWLVGALPWRALGAVGRVLAFVAGRVLRVRRREVVARLARCEVASGREAERVADGMYRSLGTGLAELLWSTRQSPAELARHVVLTPRAEAALAAARETGAIVATAHTGNWDLVACAIAGRALLTVVTKRLSNAALDRRWQSLRAARGVDLVDAAGATGRCLAAARACALVALLVDQAPAAEQGTIVHPFLGQEALHALAPAVLAERARVPLLVAFGRRMPDGSHEVDVPLVLHPPARGGRSWAAQATRDVADALGAFVRAHPEAWLWLHRRWKRPAARGTREPWTTSSASARTPSALACSSEPGSTATWRRHAPRSSPAAPR